MLATKTDGTVNWCELYAVTEGDIIPVITSNDGSEFTIDFSNKNNSREEPNKEGGIINGR